MVFTSGGSIGTSGREGGPGWLGIEICWLPGMVAYSPMEMVLPNYSGRNALAMFRGLPNLSQDLWMEIDDPEG